MLHAGGYDLAAQYVVAIERAHLQQGFVCTKHINREVSKGIRARTRGMVPLYMVRLAALEDRQAPLVQG